MSFISQKSLAAFVVIPNSSSSNLFFVNPSILFNYEVDKTRVDELIVAFGVVNELGGLIILSSNLGNTKSKKNFSL